MMSLIEALRSIKKNGFTPEVLDKYSKDELYAIQKILAEIEEFGRSDTLEALWEQDFETRPVTIDEFLEDEYYLGRIGADVFEIWRKDLRAVLTPYDNIVEWVIKGSIGSGKTFVAVIAILYKIYWLTCLHNPQRFFGLAEGSPIVFGLFNIFKYLAQATSYQYMTAWLRDMSPYFESMRPKDPRNPNKFETNKEVLKFPKNIQIALGSTAINALGQNIFGGLCDETEFGKNKSITSEEKSQIADLYHGIRTRMDSRFMQRGGANPGLLCLVSSARDYEQFLAQHVQQKANDPHTHISAYALYEVKDHVYRDSPRFSVVVGDKLNRSYILEDQPEGHEPRHGATILEVPVEFYDAFEYDIDTAIRDIAGHETYGKTLYLPRRDKLLECYEQSTPRVHPFSKDTVVLSLEDEVHIEDYFQRDRIIRLIDKTNNVWQPKFYPSADRFIHVDLSKNRDCAGFAMSCISEMREIKRITDEGLAIRARDYVFFSDIQLRIKAAHGSEIDFSKIRRFIFFLMNTCHFNVVWVSYDSYQSTDSLQTFKKEKVQAKEFSVDKKPGPYRVLRSIIMEVRLDAYHYEPFYEEVTKLEDHSLEGGKHKPLIDHPKNGSKDVSDAVCGTINGAMIHKGVQITGTDAEAMMERAKEYQKQMKAQISEDKYKVDSKFVKGGLRKENPLEELFK